VKKEITMAKKARMPLTPEQIAEKANPGWKAVAPPAVDASKRIDVDATAVEVEKILEKHGRGKKAVPAKAARAAKGPPKEARIVLLESKTPTDLREGRKASVIEGDREIGKQG
jgi:hypothetical protein